MYISLVSNDELYIYAYVEIYNTARFFPRFPSDGLVLYIVYIHGLFIYLHGSRMEPHPINAFDWM